MFECDLRIEVEAVDRLRRGIEYMRSIGDITSARLFEDILADEEHHVDYLETQLGLIEKLGEERYLQNVTEHPAPGGGH
jgi:bacterioferritin